MLAATCGMVVRGGILAFPTSVEPVVPNAPRSPRIVSLVGGVTDTLVALGAADAIMNGSRRMSAEGMPDLRPTVYANERSGAVNAEGILALDPDVVFVARELMPGLRGRGLNLEMVPQDTFADIEPFVVKVGFYARDEAGARELLIAMKRTMDSIRARVKGRPRVRVYYEDGLPGRTRGPGTAVHEMIELAGGINVYADPSVPRPTISLETIVAADPEVIVVPSSVTLDALRARPGWAGVSAVRNGRVHSISEADRSVTLYSPNCAACCERTFVRWFHPELTMEGGPP